MAAFIPGESPPDVNTPIFFIEFDINVFLLKVKLRNKTNNKGAILIKKLGEN